MPPVVTPTFTAHEKFYLAAYLLGKKTFADMKKELTAPVAIELLKRAAQMEGESPDEFRKIFGEVEDARVFFDGAGGANRGNLIDGVRAEAQPLDGTVQLPQAADSTKEAYKAIPCIGPDIIGETLKALEEHAKANPAQKADYDTLANYIREHVLELRVLLTQKVLACIGGEAEPAGNAIGNAIRTALLEASNPGNNAHPHGICHNQDIYEILGTGGEGWLAARGGGAHAANVTLAANGAGIQAIDTKLRANVGKEVLLALAAGLERYAQQSVEEGSPDALHRAAAVAAAKTLRERAATTGIVAEQIAVAHAISRNLALENVNVGGNIAAAVNAAIQEAITATAGSVGVVAPAGDNLTNLKRAVWAEGKAFAADPAAPPPAERIAEVSTNLHQLLTEADKELAKDTSEQGKQQAIELKQLTFDGLEKTVRNAEKDLHERMDAIAKAAEEQANAVGNDAARQRLAGIGLQTLANWQQYENEHLLKTDALMSQLLGGANVADVLKGFGNLKTETVADVFEAKMKAAVGFDQLTEVNFYKAKIIQARLAQDTLNALEALAKLQANRNPDQPHVEDWLRNAVNDVRRIVGALSGKVTSTMNWSGTDIGDPVNPGIGLPQNIDNIHLALFHLHRIFSRHAADQNEDKMYANAAFTSMGYVEVARATASNTADAAAAQVAVQEVINQQKDKLPGGAHSLGELNTKSQENAIISAYKRLAEEIASQGIVSSHNGDTITISGIIGKTADTRTELKNKPLIEKERKHYYQKHIYVDYTPANLAKKQAEMLTIRKGGVAAVKVTMEKAFDLWPHGIVVNGGKVGGKERREILRLSLLHVLEGNGSFTVEIQNPKPNANEQKEIELISKLGKAIQKYQSDIPAEGNSPYEKMMVEARNAAVVGDIPADKNKANAKILLKVLRESHKYFKDKPEAIVLEMARNLKILGKVGVNEHTKETARKRIAAIIIVSTKEIDWSAKGIDSETRDGILTKLEDMYYNFDRLQAANPQQDMNVISARGLEGKALVEVVDKMKRAVEAANAMQLETKNPLTKFLHKGAELKEDMQKSVNNMVKPF